MSLGGVIEEIVLVWVAACFLVAPWTMHSAIDTGLAAAHIHFFSNTPSHCSNCAQVAQTGGTLDQLPDYAEILIFVDPDFQNVSLDLLQQVNQKQIYPPMGQPSSSDCLSAAKLYVVKQCGRSLAQQSNESLV